MKYFYYVILLPLAGLAGYRTYKVLTLKYFRLMDFRGMHVWLSTGVLDSLDAFAGKLAKQGCPVIVSPAPGAIVRFPSEKNETTDHFKGNAIDIMLPKGPTFREAVVKARESGFNAIGIYPYWKPYKGLHVAIRYPLDKFFKWADLGRPDPETGKVEHLYVNIEQGYNLG